MEGREGGGGEEERGMSLNPKDNTNDSFCNAKFVIYLQLNFKNTLSITIKMRGS